MGNSFTAPLTSQQKTVWQLVSQGLSVSLIASNLNTTRQYVNQTRLTAEAKLSSTLLGVAQVNDLQVLKINAKNGILLGYHPALNKKAIVTYSSKFGLKLWYWHDNPEEVTNQEFLNQTRTYLLDLSQERGIAIEDGLTIHPGKLAHIIFKKLVLELKE